MTFGRWIRNSGLAALFADLTNTSQRIREEVWKWRDVISNIAVDGPTGLLDCCVQIQLRWMHCRKRVELAGRES